MLANCIRQQAGKAGNGNEIEGRNGNQKWKLETKMKQKMTTAPSICQCRNTGGGKGLIGNGRLAKQAIKNWRQEELWNA